MNTQSPRAGSSHHPRLATLLSVTEAEASLAEAEADLAIPDPTAEAAHAALEGPTDDPDEDPEAP